MTYTTNKNPTQYRKDYAPAGFDILAVHLNFALQPQATVVTATTSVRKRNADVSALVLNGEHVKLVSVAINGLGWEDYTVDDTHLSLHAVPDEFELTVVTQINPADNKALEGLYQSSGNFCTQCEAEGFRRITYYLDRPDVLTTFTTRIEADKTDYPVLLSNGNLVESGDLPHGKHFATWHDPHPKPCYLFALVAGQLEYIQDTFTTRSGREVDLRIYVQSHNIDQCDYAMESLKNSMKWDEDRFGLEYDLDIFMIVAVDDFNMGAMENKGLNIFNSKFILAKPETATDTDFQGIEAVVGHEYFHNWTGNRITCRDWFQLSLKEGLTVFRDQEFSADSGSRDVKRIEDVKLLRAHQFVEDSGPMAHPIRPDSYQEINNFYTLTVYEKGAEVIRMLHTMLGEEGFQKGMQEYVARHDGQAVTCDDFVDAMADANGKDFSLFKHWYEQAGTPVIDVQDGYDTATQTYTLSFQQHTPDTFGQSDKKPVMMPIKLALLDEQGHIIADTAQTFILDKAQDRLEFKGIASRPTPSLLRGFSAPVKLNYPYTPEQLAFLAVYDDDAFNRWEASQRVYMQAIETLLACEQKGETLSLPAHLPAMIEHSLEQRAHDKALIAYAITLPDARTIAEHQAQIDPHAIDRVHTFLMTALAKALKPVWLEHYHENNVQEAYAPSAEQIAERTLKNTCLAYLMHLPSNDVYELCLSQCVDANNMTDALSALKHIASTQGASSEDVLANFYTQWQHNKNVVDKWLAVQASAHRPNVLETVRALMQHEAFAMTNPNAVRALIGAFVANAPAFHAPSGEGYAFLADRVIELDAFNPQVASRLVSAFNLYKRYTPELSALMLAQMQRIDKTENLSKDVAEILSKALKQ